MYKLKIFKNNKIKFIKKMKVSKNMILKSLLNFNKIN